MFTSLRSFLVIMFLMTSFSSRAFNWEKCKSRNLYGGSGVEGIIFNFSTSTSQFVSSTGNCAAIGKADHDSKLFIALNFEKMKVDFSKGEGEYAAAFAEFYYCKEHEKKIIFSMRIKEKYQLLLDAENKSMDHVHTFMKSELEKSCFVRKS
jgi:hypothetical protein